MPTRLMRACVLSMLATAALPAWPQDTVPDEYAKHIKQRSSIAPWDSELVGEHVDLSSGSLEITQTDVDLPGNNGLAVHVGRRFEPGNSYRVGHFDRWDLDIPNVHGVFASTGDDSGWISSAATYANRFNRCSYFSAPPGIAYQGGSFEADEFWQGTSLYLPGSGEQELLLKPVPNAHVPTDGYSYPVVTREGAAVRCVSLASTSETGSQGEGFEVVTADGVVYTLNHLVSRLESTFKRSTPGLISLSKQTGQPVATQRSIPVNLVAGYVLPRREFLLYPTKVTDRFGNTLTYIWNVSNPWQLQQIVASDGRHLDFTYLSASSIRVTRVTDGARTWLYGYAGMPSDLDTLTLPDNSKWSYQLGNLRNAAAHPSGVTCDGQTSPGGNYVGSITSPSGATVEFTMTAILTGRSWVFRECVPTADGAGYPREPYLVARLAVTAKKLTGPGLPATGSTWTYTYGTSNHCWDPASVPVGNYAGLVPCSASSPTTRSVSVTDPQGAVTRYTYGNRFRINEGLLLTTESGWNGRSALRTEMITYSDPGAAPYASFNGSPIRHIGDYDLTGSYHPGRQITTTQQGRIFTWQVAADCGGGYCFDTFARPTKVVKTSTTP